MTYDQSSNYDKLNNRLSRYVQSVIGIWDSLSLEASKIALSTGHNGEEPFKFSDYPITTARVDDLRRMYVEDIRGIVYSGIDQEWKNSNIAQDLLANDVLKSYSPTIKGKKRYKKYYDENSEVLEAFKHRKKNGLNLSQNLWNQSADMVEEMENVLSVAIQEGTDAVTLSKKVSKYLQDFDKFKNDYTEKFGHATEVKDCEYRSIRLARSEINMAYREAEWQRWQKFDFVKGIRISISRNGEDRRAKNPHIADVCDELAGDYPKYFKWLGWHPNCRCFATPILMSEEEFFNHQRGDDVKGVVEDVPNGFKDWVKGNEQRIVAAERTNTLPYFLKDNKDEYIKWLNFDYKTYESNLAHLKETNEYDKYIRDLNTAKFYSVHTSLVERLLLQEDIQVSSRFYEELDSMRFSIRTIKKECDTYVREIRRIPRYAMRANEVMDAGLYVNGNIKFFLDNYDLTDNQIAVTRKRFPIEQAKIYAESIEDKLDAMRRRFIKLSDNKIAEILGLPKERYPMGILEADEKRGNPHKGEDIDISQLSKYVSYYGKHRKPYDNNCATCAAVYLARRRGLNVEAKGLFKDAMTEELFRDYKQAYIDPKTLCLPVEKTIRLKGNTLDEMIKEINNYCGNQGIYVIRFERQDVGHVANLEVTKRKVLRYIDEQSGYHEIVSLENELAIIKKPRKVHVLRIDNLAMNPRICSKVMVKKE